MADASVGGLIGGTPEDRLDSWKEIAAYLKRDVTTVQRWEKREGMPVHRHLHDKLGSVYAFRTELDAWTRSRNLRTAPDVPDAAARADLPETVDSLPPPPGSRQNSRRSFSWFIAAAAVVVAIAVELWHLDRTDRFWRNPLDGARFQYVTDFGGTAEAASISRDGRLVAFLSDRDGQMDVWVTQVGTGAFYNLTRGRIAGLVNPSLRTLGFSPDGSLVTFWARTGPDPGAISIRAIPTLGGTPQMYLEGAAEYDWSSDGTKLVYHTPGPGDPMFVKASGQQTQSAPLFTAAVGLHAHFPIWSPDGAFIYFVQGGLDQGVLDARDIWRVAPSGGSAERVVNGGSRVSYPVLLDDRTLMYLATAPDGSGPALYALDVNHRVPHRVTTGPDRYTSLAASADGRRLVATLANQNGTLWRMSLADTPVGAAAATPVPLITGRGSSPRYGPGYLLYVSSKGTGDGLWKLVDHDSTQIWSASNTRIVGGPEISPDGTHVAFSAQRNGKPSLYVMDVDGSHARVVTASLPLRGSPAWSPDGRSITSAVATNGVPRLYRIGLDGTASPLLQDYSIDPVWSRAGDFLLYSGPDVGTTFSVKAMITDGKRHAIPNLLLTRGARRLRFLPDQHTILVLRGDLDHKDLWSIDLETGVERQITRLAPDFTVRDFDVSADGREVILERVQQHSDIVLIDLSHRG